MTRSGCVFLAGALLVAGITCTRAPGERPARRKAPEAGAPAPRQGLRPDLGGAGFEPVLDATGVDSFAGLGPAAIEAAQRRPGSALAPPAEAPITVTARQDSRPDEDPEAVRLVQVKARAVVQGPLAFTELHLVVDNPADRVVEGWLRVRLPSGAAVSRLAMLLPGGWEEAEVVERFRAREVYEGLVRRQIDPALVEKEEDDAIRLRVFPIAAKGRKEVKIAWSEVRPTSAAPYRLRLKGLGKLDRLDARVLVSEAGGGAPRVMEVQLSGGTPDRDLLAAVEPGKAIQGVQSGALAVARVPTSGGALRSPAGALLLLVETSAQVAIRFPEMVDQVAALVRALREQFGDAVPLRVAGFDQTVGVIYQGTVGGFGAAAVRALRSRMPLGRSNLGNALAWAAQRADGDRVVLVTALAPTTGATGHAALETAVSRLGPRVRRLDLVLLPGLRAPVLAGRLVRGRLAEDGVVLDDSEPPEQWAGRISRPAAYDVRVAVPGARWSWPTTVHRHQPGDELLVYASLPEGRPGTVQVQVADRPAVMVALGSGHEALVRRAWAGARIAELEGQLARLPPGTSGAVSPEQREIARLSREHRVLSSQTALLLLETDADYRRHAIQRTALPDVLTVNDAGLTFERRQGAVRSEPTHSPATDEAPPLLLRRAAGEMGGGGSGTRLGGWGGLGKGGGGGGGFGLGGAGGGFGIGRRWRQGPSVFLGKSTVSGGLDPDTFRRVVRRHLQEVQYCYVSIGLPDRPSLAGRLTVRIDVDAKGLVSGAVVQESTLSHASTESCVVAAVRRWRFPKPEGATVQAVYPFRFEPGKPPTLSSLVAVHATTLLGGELRDLMQLIRRGKVEVAVARALTAYLESPEDLRRLVVLGEVVASARAPALAARIQGTVAEYQRESGYLLWLAASRLELLGGPHARLALSWYREALRSEPRSVGFAVAVAFALLRSGLPGEAFATLEAATPEVAPGQGGEAGPLLALLALLGEAWVEREPAQRVAIADTLRRRGATLPTAPAGVFLLLGTVERCDPLLVIQDGRSAVTHALAKALPSGGTLDLDLSQYRMLVKGFRYGGSPPAFPYHLRLGTFVEDGSADPHAWYSGRVEALQVDGRGKVRYRSTPFLGNETIGGPVLATITAMP